MYHNISGGRYTYIVQSPEGKTYPLYTCNWQSAYANARKKSQRWGEHVVLRRTGVIYVEGMVESPPIATFENGSKLPNA